MAARDATGTRKARNRRPQMDHPRPPAVERDATAPRSAMSRHRQTVPRPPVAERVAIGGQAHRPRAVARDATCPRVSPLPAVARDATHPQLRRHRSRAGHNAQSSPARPLKTPPA